MPARGWLLSEYDYPALAAPLGVSTYVHSGSEVPPYYDYARLSPAAFYRRGTRVFAENKGPMKPAILCARVAPEDRHLVLAGAFMHDLMSTSRATPLAGLRGANYRDGTFRDAQHEISKIFEARDWPRWHHASTALPNTWPLPLLILFGQNDGPFATHDYALESHELSALLEIVVADLLARYELRTNRWEDQEQGPGPVA